jgi:hypothetical protein
MAFAAAFLLWLFVHKSLVEELKERYHLEDIEGDGRIILKYILKE